MQVGHCVLLVPALALLCGCGGAPDATPSEKSNLEFVVLAPRQTSFWDAVKLGMTHAVSSSEMPAAGCRATMLAGDGTAKTQLAQLQRLATRTDLAGVAVCPEDSKSEALAEELRKFTARGIPVVTIDSDVDREKFRDVRAAYVGVDNRALGRALGEAATQLAGGGGYVLFSGNPDSQRSIDRIRGFQEGVGNRWKCLRTIDDRFDPAVIRREVREAIRTFAARLSAFVALEAGPAVAVADAVREAGPSRDLKVLAGDTELR